MLHNFGHTFESVEDTGRSIDLGKVGHESLHTGIMS